MQRMMYGVSNRVSEVAPEMWVEEQSGAEMMTPEISWFVYDVFKHELNGEEKLVFYSYYYNGMTMKEIGEAADCTTGNIERIIRKIEKKLQKNWKKKDR